MFARLESIVEWCYPRMYIYILLDAVLAMDVNKYSLASGR